MQGHGPHLSALQHCTLLVCMLLFVDVAWEDVTVTAAVW